MRPGLVCHGRLETITGYPSFSGTGPVIDVVHEGPSHVELAVIAILVVVFLVIGVLLVRDLRRTRRTRLAPVETGTAGVVEAFLAQRLASGELTADQYRERLEAIGGSGDEAGSRLEPEG